MLFIFCFGFDQDRNRRKQELTKNNLIKGKYLVRLMLKVVFSFAGRQEKATYRLR